ncbi:hypothetical protein [Skermanella pratensis]|uniref:hypothetical protein n=1 Tax=Skermanella pratensis TaxID=2233999 RepID=UPI0017888FEE|nr:hypothetical protein [Skermanella pratensis]
MAVIGRSALFAPPRRQGGASDPSGALIEYGVTEDLFTAPKQKHAEEQVTGRFG